MSITRVPALLVSLALVAACGEGKTEKVASAEAKTPAEKAEKAEKAPEAATPESDEDEEGCVYEDAHKKHEGEADCPHMEAEGVDGHFGAVFALTEPKPLSSVLSSAGEGESDPIQVSGQIDQVCQKKGCWMVLKEGEAVARVLMKDHSFTVPMDSKGKDAVVEGTIKTRTFNEAQVKHLEKDAGGDPTKVAGERTEYVLTASAVEIPNS